MGGEQEHDPNLGNNQDIALHEASKIFQEVITSTNGPAEAIPALEDIIAIGGHHEDINVILNRFISSLGGNLPR